MAINTTEISDIFKNIVECCICEEPFTDPRILPCFHTFCVNCLKEIGSKDSKGPGDIIPCPQCSAVFTLPLGGFMGLQKNLFMDKLLGVIDRSSQQSVCDMNTGSCSSVGWYCKECKQKLCAECSILHKTIKTQKNHHVVPFENHADSLQSFDINNSTFCDRHEKERLKLFCNDCKVVLCTFCFLENHQTHKWSKVTDAAKLFRTHITRNIDMLSSCVSETRSSNEESNIRLSATVMNVESAIKAKKLQVKAMLERIVDEDERSLLLRLTSLTQRASKQHEMKAEEIFRHQMKLDKYIMFCKEIAAQGSDVDICRAASEVENRAKELKDLLGTATDRQTTRFQITFEDNKSEDLLKTRYGNLLGQIEVSNDKLTSGNELFENSSLAAKPKLKNAIAIIDPSTGENVLETLEIESIQTSDEALKIKSEFAHKVVQTIINGGKKTTNFQSEENKAKQPLFGATRPNNFLTTAPACFAPDKQGNVEEKLMTAEENQQEKVQDRGKEKSDEKMLENILNKGQQERQEQKQERTQGPAPIIAKQLQVENDDTQKPPLDAEPLQMGQKSRELGSGQSKTKTEKTHVLIPDDSRSDKRTNTELLRPTWTISSSPSEETPPNPRRRAIIMYDREFLLQLRYMPESLKTPLWLSNCPDISLSMRASLPHRNNPSQIRHEIFESFASEPLNTSGTSVKRDSSQKRSEETPPNPRRRAIIMYDREFLLQLRYMPESLKTPLWLSNCPDISLSMRASLPHRNNPSQIRHEIFESFASEPLNTSGTSVKRDSSQKRSEETPPNPRRRAIIMYDREFLLQLRYMPESLKTPLWLSDCPDISLSMRASLPHRDTPSQTHHEITPRFAPQPLDTSGTSVKRDSSQKRSKGRSRRPQFTCEELSIIKTGQA